MTDGQKLMAIGLWIGLRAVAIAAAIGLVKFGQYAVRII